MDLTQDVTALLLADRVLGLVDAGNEHGNPDDNRQEHEKNSTDELDRAEDSTDLKPSLVDLATTFTLSFSCESLTSDQSLFLPDQSIQFALILSRHTLLSAGIAHLDLSLAFTILFQLRLSCLVKLRS